MLKANKEKRTMARSSKHLLKEDLGGFVVASEVLVVLKEEQAQQAQAANSGRENVEV